MPNVIGHGPGRAGNNDPRLWLMSSAERQRTSGECRAGGLPVAYFMRQIQDFRNGLRHTADPRKPNTNTMIELAKAMTDEEMKAAAEYFAAMKWTPWIRVVETNLVPKTRIAGNLFLPREGERPSRSPDGSSKCRRTRSRRKRYRNPHSGFVAYVPPGSIKKGKDLVTTGGMRIVGNEIVQGKTTPCVTCHGLDLMGVADVPPIAGRSPSYMVRQIWDMQQGTRNGASAQLMKLVIANLTEEDMVAIAAYVSSRAPKSAATTLH